MNHDDNDWTRGFEFIDRMGNADLYGIWDPAGAGEIFKGGAAPAWATDLATIPLEAWNALGGARTMPPAVACDRANRHGCTLNPLRGTEAEGIPFGLYTRFAAVPYGCPKDSLLLVCARDADGASTVEVYGRKDWKDGINALRAVGIDRNALAEYMQNGVRAVGAHTPCKANPRYNLVSDLLDALDISDAAGVREVGAALAKCGGMPPRWPAGPEAEDAAEAVVNVLRRTGSSMPAASAEALWAFLEAVPASFDETQSARIFGVAVQALRLDAVRMVLEHSSFTVSNALWEPLRRLRYGRFDGRDLAGHVLPAAAAMLAEVVGAECPALDLPWNGEDINPIYILCALIRAGRPDAVTLHLGGTLGDPDAMLANLCKPLERAMEDCNHGISDDGVNPVDLALLGRYLGRALAERDGGGAEAGPALRKGLALVAKTAAACFEDRHSRYWSHTPCWAEDGSAPVVLLRWAAGHGYVTLPESVKI